MDKIVTDLCRDHDFVPLIWERLGDEFLAEAIPVSISRVEQGDTEIERLVHELDCFTFGKISPPTGGNCPQAKANLADRQISIFVRPEAHYLSLDVQRSTLNAQASIKLDIERWALDVERFSCDRQIKDSAAHRCSRLDGESGLERADAGTCCGDSATENFCGCPVRFLEGGTEFARRALFV